MEELLRNIDRLGIESIDGLNNLLDGINLTSAIKAQIDSGIRGNGAELRPTYMEDPFFSTPEDAQKWIRKYRKFDTNSYPQWGLATRKVNTPNLNITGRLFFDFITADNQNGLVEIQAVGSPIEAELRAKYGDDILSLSPQVKAVIFERMQERLQQIATNLGFRWVVDV